MEEGGGRGRIYNRVMHGGDDPKNIARSLVVFPPFLPSPARNPLPPPPRGFIYRGYRRLGMTVVVTFIAAQRRRESPDGISVILKARASVRRDAETGKGREGRRGGRFEGIRGAFRECAPHSRRRMVNSCARARARKTRHRAFGIAAAGHRNFTSALALFTSAARFSHRASHSRVQSRASRNASFLRPRIFARIVDRRGQFEPPSFCDECNGPCLRFLSIAIARRGDHEMRSRLR